MATGAELFEARHKFEATVIEALGLPADKVAQPLTVDDCGFVSFHWVGEEPPPEPPHGGWFAVTGASGEPLCFTAERAALGDGVWDAIHAARREWVDFFFAAHGIHHAPKGTDG